MLQPKWGTCLPTALPRVALHPDWKVRKMPDKQMQKRPTMKGALMDTVILLKLVCGFVTIRLKTMQPQPQLQSHHHFLLLVQLYNTIPLEICLR